MYCGIESVKDLGDTTLISKWRKWNFKLTEIHLKKVRHTETRLLVLNQLLERCSLCHLMKEGRLEHS